MHYIFYNQLLPVYNESTKVEYGNFPEGVDIIELIC